VGQTDSQTKSQWQSLTPSFGGAKLSKQIMVRELITVMQLQTIS